MMGFYLVAAVLAALVMIAGILMITSSMNSNMAFKNMTHASYLAVSAVSFAIPVIRYCIVSPCGVTSVIVSPIRASRHYQQTVLMITHNMNLTSAADRIFRVTDGVLEELGSKVEN